MIEEEFIDHVIVTLFCAPLTWLWFTFDNDIPQCDVMFFWLQYIGTLDVPRPTSRVEIVAAMRRIRVSGEWWECWVWGRWAVV